MNLPDISKLSGLSVNGVNLWGDNKSIEAALRWEHSHGTIGDVRTNLSHWRDECGKVHAHRLQMLEVLKRVVSVLDDEVFNELAAANLLRDASALVERFDK